MIPNPEYLKTRLWEQEQDLIHDHLSVPRGMGPRAEKELLDAGVRLGGPRQLSLISSIVRFLIQVPAGRIRSALRPSSVSPRPYSRRSTDVVISTSASDIAH